MLLSETKVSCWPQNFLANRLPIRQEKHKDWEGVIERVAAELADLAKDGPNAG